jgi:glycosyltransferase involved in cell wall biosynthesis
MAARLAIMCGKPLVVSPHGEILPVALSVHSFRKSVYMRILTRKLFTSAAGFHALTSIEEMAIYSKFPGAKTVMIPNGIEPVEAPSNTDVELANELWPPLVDRTVILFMGRLHQIKGIDLLLQALKLAIGKNQDIRLLIAGSDFGAEAELRRLSNELNLEDHVVWAGHLDGQDKAAALAMCDISVLPSKSDVVGLATLEAMQAGRPVIITEECGGEVIAEEGAGIIVKSDPVQMSDAIVQLGNDRDMARIMGSKGKKTVATHFNTTSSATKLNNFYRSIIE